MRRIENMLVYFAVAIMIGVSFKMPEILIGIENKQIEKEVYEKEKNENSLDVEAEEIYLVKAIHSMESGNYMITLNSENMKNGKSVLIEVSKNTKNDVEEELLKLKQYNILGNFEYNDTEEMQIGIINKVYRSEEDQYQIDSFFLKIGNNEYYIDREYKTGKILCVGFKKEDTSICSSKEELMKNYIQYLNLYIIDDWKYEDDMCISQKANLVINLVEDQDMFILSIHTINRMMNEVEVVKSIKN